MKAPYNTNAIKLLGKKIRELRKKQNLSQAQLAFECEMPREQLYRIELGQINTSVNNIFIIAKTLNISPKELFEFEIK